MRRRRDVRQGETEGKGGKVRQRDDEGRRHTVSRGRRSYMEDEEEEEDRKRTDDVSGWEG